MGDVVEAAAPAFGHVVFATRALGHDGQQELLALAELGDHLRYEVARLAAVKRDATEPAQKPAHRPDEGRVLHDEMHVDAQRGHRESGHKEVAVRRMRRADEDETRQVGRVPHDAPAEETHEEGEERARQPVATPRDTGPHPGQFGLLNICRVGQSRLHAVLTPAVSYGRRTGGIVLATTDLTPSSPKRHDRSTSPPRPPRPPDDRRTSRKER